MSRFVPVLLILILFGTGCEALDIRPRAVGREGDIMVVTDSMSWKGEIGDALREELGAYINTLPAPERLFDLKQTGITSNKTLKLIKRQKNVIFVAPLSDSTREARYLLSTLDEAAANAVVSLGTVAVLGHQDEWASEQQVYFLLGRDASQLAQAIRQNAEGIRYNFNRATRRRLMRTMFDTGRQEDLEARIMDSHGFTVNAQHDYLVAMDTTNFVWLRRIVSSDSWRSLFVWYTDEMSPADLTAEWALDVRDRLTTAYVQGNLGGHVVVDNRRPLEAENIDFLGRFGYEIRGLWYMVGPDENGNEVQFGGGGPFVTYAFYDEESRRTYLIDGMVFAPGFQKREFLRHMETIAHSFRTQADVSDPPGDSTSLEADVSDPPGDGTSLEADGAGPEAEPTRGEAAGQPLALTN
jgi:uncharacterized protein DUF4837